MSMDDAWAKFDEAVSWEQKANSPGKDGQPKTDQMKRMALKQSDKKLDDAVALEAAAVDGGEMADAA